MNNIIFNSNRYFTVFDYFISHAQLLIRSDKRDRQQTNIDVIFFDTTFMQLFTMLKGITIRTADKAKISDYGSVKKYLSGENSTLFEIESGNEKYYIAASFVKVFENELEFNETSLGMVHKGREKEIASSR